VSDPRPGPTAGLLDTAELTRRLRETEAELARVTLRLRRLESSGTVQLAQLLAAALRNPRRGVVELPRETATLVRRWRRRRAARRSVVLDGSPPAGRRGRGQEEGGAGADERPRRAASPSASRGGKAGAGLAGDSLPDRLLAASAVLVATRDRPVLAVVAEPWPADTWSEGAHVQRLRPDDAAAVFAAVSPDLLVVDARAGQSGPWSGLGTYAAPDRDRTVLELLRAARDRAVPTVLVRPVPPEEAPMLADARPLFTGEAPAEASLDDLLAAGRVAP
jgi:hypothetical protein